MGDATTGTPVERSVAGTALRFLTFRAPREDWLLLDHRHLALGLICTWAVGIGRYWDHPNAHPLQYLGAGSLMYVVLLSLLLWLVIAPLRPQDWSYKRVLTFVSLTSAPAALYAIPVERFYDLETARTINVWFLLVVAAWRVALLGFCLNRMARLRVWAAAVATLLPLTVIIAALASLNLERAVFDIMGGLRQGGTAHDNAYQALVGLAILSFLAVGPLFLTYLVLIVEARRRNETRP